MNHRRFHTEPGTVQERMALMGDCLLHGAFCPNKVKRPIPNPGSDEAQAMGCRCAVFDNNHGRSAPWPPDGWWINATCPIHAKGWTR